MDAYKVIEPEAARQAIRRQPARRPQEVRWPTVLAASLVVTAALFLLLLAPPSGQVPMLAGHRLLVVISGSMAPAVRTGDMVLVRPLAPAAVAIGDIVTYRDRADSGLLITHRVAAITQGRHGPVFVTKGDANAVQDPLPVEAAQLLGRVTMRLPYAGYAISFLRAPAGIVSLIVCPAVFLMLAEIKQLRRLLRKSEEA